MNVSEGSRHSACAVLGRLFSLAGPVIPFMAVSVLFGVVGQLCAITLMVAGAACLAVLAGYPVGCDAKMLVCVFVACGVLRGVFHFIEQYSGHDVAFRLLAVLRTRLFNAIHPLAPAKLVDRRSGDMVFSSVSDIEYLEIFYAHTVAPVAIAVLVSTVVLAFLWRINPLISMVAFPFYPLIGLGASSLSARIQREPGRRFRELLARVNEYLVETFQGLRELMAFGQGVHRRSEVRRKGLELGRAHRSLNKRSTIARVIVDFLMAAAVASTLSVCWYLWTLDQLTPGMFLVALVAVLSSFGPVIALVSVGNPLSQTLAAAERILALMDDRPLVTDPPRPRTIPEAFDPVVEFDRVSFSYAGGESVLQEFSLKVEPGSRIALVGESGCGKTTALRLLLRFWDVDGGAVRIGGLDIREMTQKDLRSLMTIVSQSNYLFDESVEENILLSRPGASHDQVVEAAKAAGMHQVLDTLPDQYNTRAMELGTRFSGGERQRIAIARAFLSDAPILIMDEATSDLDALNEHEIQQALARCFHGKTVITVAHRLATIKNADVIYVMSQGRIVESGSHTELVGQGGIYAKMAESQRA